MQLFIYNLGINLYFFAARFLALFNAKAKKFIHGRRSLFTDLSDAVIQNEKYIWVHCASLGEFEQGRPLIEGFKEKFPGFKIILTFFSPSGFEIRKNYELADIVSYLPKDSINNAGKFLSIVNPSLAVFVKYEFWYHFLNEMSRKDIPVFLVSAVFRKNQPFFGLMSNLYRKMLTFYDEIFVQDEESCYLLKSINMGQVIIAGDTRFDRVLKIAQNKSNLPEIESWAQKKQCFIAGSIWPSDLSILIDIIEQFDFKFILAPHEPTENFIKSLQQKIDKKTTLFSQNNVINNEDILIIDTIGHLSTLYQLADFAYIGGAFHNGLHNILEAAVHGMPVFVGKSHQNSKFKEVLQMVKAGGCFEIADSNDLKAHLNLFAEAPKLKNETAMISSNYVCSKAGASEKILDYSKLYLSS